MAGTIRNLLFLLFSHFVYDCDSNTILYICRWRWWWYDDGDDDDDGDVDDAPPIHSLLDNGNLNWVRQVSTGYFVILRIDWNRREGRFKPALKKLLFWQAWKPSFQTPQTLTIFKTNCPPIKWKQTKIMRMWEPSLVPFMPVTHKWQYLAIYGHLSIRPRTTNMAKYCKKNCLFFLIFPLISRKTY